MLHARRGAILSVTRKRRPWAAAQLTHTQVIRVNPPRASRTSQELFAAHLEVLPLEGSAYGVTGPGGAEKRNKGAAPAGDAAQGPRAAARGSNTPARHPHGAKRNAAFAALPAEAQPLPLRGHTLCNAALQTVGERRLAAAGAGGWKNNTALKKP